MNNGIKAILIVVIVVALAAVVFAFCSGGEKRAVDNVPTQNVTQSETELSATEIPSVSESAPIPEVVG